MIKHEGAHWILYSMDGTKKLGTHDTEAEAKTQEAAVQAAKHKHAEARVLHLLGATGQVRTEMIGNKEHLVVPVVMLMEGVIHAVNAETPEFVPFETLQNAAESWNGCPVTLGHPKKDGVQCSANDHGILESHGIGTMRNVRAEGKKMLGEALIEMARAKKLHPDMYQRLAEGGTEEVSVGALVVSDKVAGKHGAKPFVGTWKFAKGDHLAFLPGGRGACSVEMGCGSHRAAMRVCADAMTLEDPMETPEQDAAEEAAELVAYKSMRTIMDACGTQWDEASTLIDALIADETESPTETAAEEEAEEQIETARIESIRMICQAMMGALSGIVNATYGSALSDVDSPRYMTALAGARHSTKDMSAIQAVHDHSMALGAVCDRSNYKQLEHNITDDDLKIKPSNLNDDGRNLNEPNRFYIESVRQRAASAR